jgi:nucleotide-binding universal stress UspA family protein
MKKILVPTDFSEYALNATKLAAKIAKRTNATIYLLHVVDIPYRETGNLPHHTAQNFPEGLAILNIAKKKYAEIIKSDFLKEVRVVEALQIGGVMESLADQAEKNGIDLIVMGTHGTSGFLSDTFVGNVTDKVIRTSNIPVITLREEIKSDNFQNIVFASDFEDIEAIPYEKLRPVMDAFNGRINLLRVATLGDFVTSSEAHENMHKFAKSVGITNYTTNLYNATQVQTGINEFAKEINADLIVAPTKGRSGLALLLNGSLAIDIVKEANPPVMTVKI